MTVLGHGTGATLVTALTVAPSARGLFQRAWATDGPGVVDLASLRDANIANQAVLRGLQCGNDELKCLRDANAEELAKQAPEEW